MDFVPHTEEDFATMLDAIGVRSFEDLLCNIPKELRRFELRLPAGLPEQALREVLMAMAGRNANVMTHQVFLGGGAYDHFIPAVVNALGSRPEFVTSYTPYQAEASQGNLQAMFEYQTAMCELTGMAISNSSLYDGATAVAEGAIAAVNVKRGRTRIVVSTAVHPDYRTVLKTYMYGLGIEVVEVPYAQNGQTDLAALKAAIDANTAGVIVQSPNFFGCIEEMADVADAAHAGDALLVAVVNPITLGVLVPPGEYGADIAVGEGQPLGIPLGYGGPYLGFFTCSHDVMRKIPGRLVGMTTDRKGRRGFVLTLQAREQHIRREKATSNICSNQALMAIRALIYTCALGKQGIGEVGRLNLCYSHYAAKKVAAVPGFEPRFDAPFFNEFVVKCSTPPAEINRGLWQEAGIVGGLELGRWYPELKDCLTLCVTETKTQDNIDALAATLESLPCRVS
ncbi:MAG: aminomethyl-transferring glycine dehydrogenase subunit GcvPA [Verrucomicrobia bacterium]|nr:aminomethyl-transferring glycine dehydrogenase subunit GcvPA [Verrucomicrobiota bacterium]